jgi:hypothetical protein
LARRVHQLVELRADPFERGDESILYEKWQVGRAFIFVPAQALVAQWLESFKEFPIRQKQLRQSGLGNGETSPTRGPDWRTACEDYGQAVTYKGGVAEQPDAFELDGHHLIECGKVFAVCGNTWRMRVDARFAPYFDFIGDFSTHLWDFPRLRDLDTLRLDRSTATSGSTVVRRTSRLGTAPSYRATVGCPATSPSPLVTLP